MLTDGISVEYRQDGRIIHDKAWLFDFKNPENNDFLAINQFTIVENDINRRPDIILFVNGFPLAVLELKNPVDEKATLDKISISTATNLSQSQIPSLFHFNAFMIYKLLWFRGSCAGTLTSDFQRFMPWKTIDGELEAIQTMPQLEVLIRGMLNKNVLMDIIRYFIVFEEKAGY